MWSKDEADNLIYVFHARTDHLGLTGRDMFVRRVHFDIEDMPVMDMEPAEEVADETVELTVEVTEPAPLEVEATTRCVAGSAVLATTLTNPGDEPVTASVATPHGKRTDLPLGAGASVAETFSTRSAESEGDDVTATVDDEEVSASFEATSCGRPRQATGRTAMITAVRPAPTVRI